MNKLLKERLGYRDMQPGWIIKTGDIVLNHEGVPEFAVGPNHPEIGNEWDHSCLPMITPKPLQDTLNKLPERIARKKLRILNAYMHAKHCGKHRRERKWSRANTKLDIRYLPRIV